LNCTFGQWKNQFVLSDSLTRHTIQRILLCVLFVCFIYGVNAQEPELSGSKKIQKSLSELPVELSVSIESRLGQRIISNDSLHNTPILSELRMQLAGSYYGDWFELRTKADIGYDQLFERFLWDLRSLNLDIYPQNWWSAKIGRQILTWGKGDFLFINDLFPKDYPSFFSGRDVQYLKAPSDGIKINLTPKWMQINLVYLPQFDPDRFLSGERISFFDPALNKFRGFESQLPTNLPDGFLKDDEWHLRLQRTFGSTSLALYGYIGNWKSPAGFSFESMAYDFPKLSVFGGSIDFPAFKGILSTEFGYYDSREDREGLNPLIRNSEFRTLIGYGRDFQTGWNFGIQFYNELMMNHEAYVSTFMGPNPKNRFYDISTISIRKRFNKQRTEAALFSFLSFQENDVYLRPSFSHSLNDFWKLSLGGNLFFGKDDFTFWNQLQFNSNVFFALKWNV